ncbi:MAG: TetR/AcrR family transcriptional regulator [Nevskiales bacterium]
MGTRERKQREVAEREQLFLDTARELIREDGLLNLVMSRIARECDYAVGTLYQHFASKEDLLIALSTVNERERYALFKRVLDWRTASTRDRFFGLAVADMYFVRSFPEHFRLAQFAHTEVVWAAASPQRRKQSLEASYPIGQMVAEMVEDAVAQGDLDLKGLKPNELALAPWSVTLGTHNLVHAEGMLEQYEMREPYRLMLRHVQSMLNGLEWQPIFDPSDDALLDEKVQLVCNEVFHDLECIKTR